MAGLLLLVLAAVFMAGYLLPYDTGFAKHLGLGSILVTLAAAPAAVVIYAFQSRQAASAQSELIEMLGQPAVDKIAEATIPPKEVEQTGLPDDEEPARQLQTASIAAGGKNLRVYKPAALPLRVLADIVDYWRHEKKQGRWNFDRVFAVARQAGRGNLPWVVLFHDDTDNLVAYKVTYAPRRNTGDKGKVEEVPLV